jgi:DNA repair protein RecN (Recombination protein N)
MLTDLRVRDLGVIEDLSLSFGPGMTALTGETGAGKTLVVEALHLVLGGRASPTMVRAGAAEAMVEARFVVGEGDDEREVILARAVPADGRSRAWVDGRMSPVAALVEVAAELVEIHGQHEHQSLVTPAAQRQVLDAYAGTDLSEVTRLRARQRELAASLAELGGDEQMRAREADVLRYQIEEIAAAGLSDPDEDLTLRSEETRLADAGALREAAAHAVTLLDPDPGSGTGSVSGLGSGSGSEGDGVLELLGRAETALSERESFDEYRRRIASSAIDLADVARALRDVVEGWEDDPDRLAVVQERRRLLAGLRRKYGEDLAAVMVFADEAAVRLSDLDNAEVVAAQLEAERLAVAEQLAAAEDKVRAVRTEAAERFGSLVGERLAALAMAGARVEVRVGSQGTGDPVELALGANVGEAVLPLAKAASGGELARAMLAIRLVALHGPSTMVFDEVDAGVGGASAIALGHALAEVAGDRQVLVVTHLAQVAAQADQQISVDKQALAGRTVTTAATIAGEDRVIELSRMLSGHPDSDAARAHARELLALSGPAPA